MNLTSSILSYKEGETLNLVILATGYPSPDVKCVNLVIPITGYPSPDVKCKQKTNTDIKNGKTSSIHVSELRYSLHQGFNYQCTAINAKGSTTWIFSLNIWGKCMCRCLHKLFLNRL